MEVFADVIDAMEPSEAEEALGEVVERTVVSCEGGEGGEERAWFVRLWGRIAAADISNDEHRSAVRWVRSTVVLSKDYGGKVTLKM